MPRDAGGSSRLRILEATGVVLSRHGHRNLQLSAVAAEAQVSRPTLYRHFGSKAGLLEAFSSYEQDTFDAGIAEAITGLRGTERLDAALRFVVQFQRAHSSKSLVDNEPGHVLAQMRRVLPVMRDRIRREICGPDADIVAAAVVRIAVCHHLVPDGHPEDFLAELRLAAGLHPRLRGAARGATGQTTGPADEGVAQPLRSATSV